MGCCVMVVNKFQASGVFCEISYCYQCKQSPKAPTHCVYVGGVEWKRPLSICHFPLACTGCSYQSQMPYCSVLRTKRLKLRKYL